MGVGASIVPKLCRQIYDSFMANDIKKAQEANWKLIKIMDIIFSVPFPSSLKAALEVMGIPCGHPRKPHAVVDRYQKRQIQDVLIETGCLKR